MGLDKDSKPVIKRETVQYDATDISVRSSFSYCHVVII